MKRAEIKALEAVAAGRVYDSGPGGSVGIYKNAPKCLKNGVIYLLESRGLVVKNGNSVEWLYSLTEAGRNVLEEVLK